MRLLQDAAASKGGQVNTKRHVVTLTSAEFVHMLRRRAARALGLPVSTVSNVTVVLSFPYAPFRSSSIEIHADIIEDDGIEGAL